MGFSLISDFSRSNRHNDGARRSDEAEDRPELARSAARAAISFDVSSCTSHVAFAMVWVVVISGLHERST